MAASQTSSRLQMLQARFQQKQLQEKEQKLLQLYDQQQQRAHQVAQRGSAGSNGSNHSINQQPAKVKQLFADERRQQNGVKGIDKSYPLEPLKNKKSSPSSKTTNSKSTIIVNSNNNMTNRKNSNIGTTTTTTTTTTRRLIKADVNSNASSSSSNSRSVGVQQQREQNNFASSRQENFSRESYAATTASSTGNSTRYSEAASGGESIRQVNGHARNGYHYEINIDEVIDNEALQRNRMLAKFQPGDIERRRRQLSAANDGIDDVDDEFPPDTMHYDAVSASRKSSLKNTKSNPTIAAVAKKMNPRQSTVMKTTQSASLKVCKPAQNRNRLVMRRKSSLVRKPKKASTEKRKKIEKKAEPVVDRCCEISERCFPPPWNTLKSTSLICEIIRKHSKLQQMRNKSKMGRVKTIVTKIENQTISIKTPAGNSAKFIPVAKSIEKRLLEMTRDVEPAASTSQEPLALLDANFVEALKAAESTDVVSRNIESEDQGDGLLSRDLADNPTDSQEITVADQTIHKSNVQGRSLEDVNRVRRASFEQKRMMFELLHRRQRVSRHNSVESALRRFDAIDDDKSDREDEQDDDKQQSYRACRKASTSSDGAARRTLRGFERSTSAWTIRTSRDKGYAHAKVVARSARKKKTDGKKILEARDSIELAKVPVITNLPACKKKIILHSKKSNDEDDDAQPLERRQSFQRRDRSSSPAEVTSKLHCFVSSIIKPETSLKKTTDAGSLVKNVPPYPSSKSPDSTEPKSRSIVKTTSMKLLSRFAGSNGDVSSHQAETDFPRKSSVHVVEAQINDEKLPSVRAPITPAPRTSPSSSSVGTTRSQGSRPTAKTKTPTPAVRTTAPSNADDSLVTCKICARRFQSERIVKHEQICAKSAQKKRKQFDVVGHRVRGTELESFVQKPSKKQTKLAASNKVEAPKSNWRRKHEDFINAIRSAKQMQVHLAAGGKLSDLPPPPPTDTSDYVQCPHCSRKFNQGAAERHIPKCESMQHNKPKPRPKR